MKWSLRREAPLLAVVVLTFVSSALAWGSAPDRLPVHWNAAGEVDRFGSRAEALLTAPITALFVYVLTLLVPRVDPGRANYENFARAYTGIRFAILAFLLAVHGLLIAPVYAVSVDVVRMLPLAIGVLLAGMGGFMGKVRPNWFFGIRTPWTLSSKRAWDRTHRVAGFLYVAAGLAIVCVALLWPRAAIAAILAGAIAPAVFCIVYSWWVWRRDPERLPPAGTLPAEDR
jgi:uncharacterized membrane protein